MTHLRMEDFPSDTIWMSWGGEPVPYDIGNRLWSRFPWPDKFPLYALAINRFGYWCISLSLKIAKPWVRKKISEELQRIR